MEDYDDRGRWDGMAPKYTLIILSGKDIEEIKTHMEFTKRFKESSVSIRMPISNKTEAYYYEDGVRVVSDPDTDIPHNMSVSDFILPTSDVLIIRDSIAYYVGEDDDGTRVESFPFNLKDLKDIKEWDPDLDK